jgi:hypothetical protein
MMVPFHDFTAVITVPAGAQGGSPCWSNTTVTFQAPSSVWPETVDCAVAVDVNASITPIVRQRNVRLLMVIEQSFPDRR